MAVTDDPFDHNAECRFCDEQGMHRADCPWIEQLVAEVDQLRELVLADEKTITHNLAEIERLRAERHDFGPLASAMRKVLPPALLAELIAHLDPLTPFVAFLQAHDDSDK